MVAAVLSYLLVPTSTESATRNELKLKYIIITIHRVFGKTVTEKADVSRTNKG